MYINLQVHDFRISQTTNFSFNNYIREHGSETQANHTTTKIPINTNTKDSMKKLWILR